MGLTAANTLPIAVEKISSKLPFLIEQDNNLDKLIQDNGRADMISIRAFRIPFETAPPSSYAKVDLDNAGVGFPAGGASEFQQGTINPVTSCAPISWTVLTELTGKTPMDVINVVSNETSRAMKQMAKNRDRTLCSGDGTGTIGTIISVNGATNTLTLDTASFGSRLIEKNQIVQIFNGSTLRPSTNTYGVGVKVVNLARQLGQANTITIDQVPAGTAAGDLIRVDGVQAQSPSFTNGILSYLTNAQTGFTLNSDRSLSPWLIANGFDAQGGGVTLPMLRLALDMPINMLGENSIKPGDIVIQTSQGQVSSYEQIGGSFATIPLEGGIADNLDPMFRGKKSVAGIPVNVNIHAHNSRWDFLHIPSWGKVKYGEGTFWHNVAGKTVFPIYGANGQPAPGMASFLLDTNNYYVDNALAQSSLYNTQSPAGYR